MNLLKKYKARLMMRLWPQKLHPSYYENEQSDGLTTAEHISLNDEYLRCFIKFKQPMPEMKIDKRALWVSNDLTCIIGMFTYMHWYNLYIKIGLNTDVAKECIVIKSEEQEHELCLSANSSINT